MSSPMPAPTTAKRAALYVRVSTADRGQTVENQLQPLQEAAGRLGWSIVAVFKDEGISGTKGRQQRPGLDALLKGVARREFDLVAAWSVCRLGRSLPDLIGLLGELQARVNPCAASISVMPRCQSNFRFRCYRTPDSVGAAADRAGHLRKEAATLRSGTGG
jgi:hypothetical protein